LPANSMVPPGVSHSAASANRQVTPGRAYPPAAT
jgi:hypothetical protein